jgi:hypothetical protein
MSNSTLDYITINKANSFSGTTASRYHSIKAVSRSPEKIKHVLPALANDHMVSFLHTEAR